MKDSWRRRASETVIAGVIRAGTSTNWMSSTTSSRVELRRRNSINFPKGNGVVYPSSFSSTRDLALVSDGQRGVRVKYSDLSFETSRKSGGVGVSFEGNDWAGSSVCSSSKQVRSRIGEAKKLGRSSATLSMDGYPVRERCEILETWGSNA